MGIALISASFRWFVPRDFAMTFWPGGWQPDVPIVAAATLV
jgi:hypothetical protein